MYNLLYIYYYIVLYYIIYYIILYYIIYYIVIYYIMLYYIILVLCHNRWILVKHLDLVYLPHVFFSLPFAEFVLAINSIHNKKVIQL